MDALQIASLSSLARYRRRQINALLIASLSLQARYCHRQMDVDSLEGRLKAGNTVTNVIACSPLLRARLLIQNLMSKFRSLNVLQFSF